jgi:hypothetical protein
VMPSRTPLSISWRLTQVCRVCGTHPILGAIESMAAHSEGYSPRCSSTIRTARSRTSGENWFDFLLMALSSLGKEPPQNPGRFKRQSIRSIPKKAADALAILQLIYDVHTGISSEHYIRTFKISSIKDANIQNYRMLSVTDQKKLFRCTFQNNSSVGNPQRVFINQALHLLKNTTSK